MGVLKYRPQFPIIHSQPGLGLLTSNMNKSDWSFFAGLTAVSLPAGYMIGYQIPVLRTRMMVVTTVIGAAGGFVAGLIRSGNRLMGLAPNQGEASHYKYRLDITDYQVRTEPFRTVIEEELQEIQDNPRY